MDLRGKVERGEVTYGVSAGKSQLFLVTYPQCHIHFQNIQPAIFLDVQAN